VAGTAARTTVPLCEPGCTVNMWMPPSANHPCGLVLKMFEGQGNLRISVVAGFGVGVHQLLRGYFETGPAAGRGGYG